MNSQSVIYNKPPVALREEPLSNSRHVCIPNKQYLTDSSQPSHLQTHRAIPRHTTPFVALPINNTPQCANAKRYSGAATANSRTCSYRNVSSRWTRKQKGVRTSPAYRGTVGTCPRYGATVFAPDTRSHPRRPRRRRPKRRSRRRQEIITGRITPRRLIRIRGETPTAARGTTQGALRGVLERDWAWVTSDPLFQMAEGRDESGRRASAKGWIFATRKGWR